jgi:hypothetical protein
VRKVKRVRVQVKPKGSAKSTKGKARRAARTAQLTKQYELLKVGKSEGGLSGAQLNAVGPIIRGRGDYELGSNIGSKLGGWIGGKLEGFVRKIFGSGDYAVSDGGIQVEQNSLVAGSGVPAMHGDNSGASEYMFHEFLGNIPMTQDYTVNSYPIDPTQAATFPWLRTIANNYQQWELVGCMFILRSLSSNTAVAPTQGLGTIMGSVRYDVNSEPPLSKVEILNSVFSSSGKPSENQVLPIECKASQTIVHPLKVRLPGAAPDDLQFYQMGWLDIATEGAPNDYTDAAELHIIYHMRLYKPRTVTGPGGPMFYADLEPTNPGLLTYLPDSYAVKQPRFDSIGIEIAEDKQSFAFPLTTQKDSVWFVQWVWNNTVTQANLHTATIVGSGGLSYALCFNNQANYGNILPAAGANTGCDAIAVMAAFSYDGTGTQSDPPTVTLALGGGLVPASPYGGYLYVTQMNPVLHTGLTLKRNKIIYTRRHFFLFLCDTIAGVTPQADRRPPPGKRIVDWVHFFTKNVDLRTGQIVHRSPSAFDMTFMEAFAVMTRYEAPVGKIVLEQYDTKDEEVDPPVTIEKPRSRFF